MDKIKKLKDRALQEWSNGMMLIFTAIIAQFDIETQRSLLWIMGSTLIIHCYLDIWAYLKKKTRDTRKRSL